MRFKAARIDIFTLTMDEMNVNGEDHSDKTKAKYHPTFLASFSTLFWFYRKRPLLCLAIPYSKALATDSPSALHSVWPISGKFTISYSATFN